MFLLTVKIQISFKVSILNGIVMGGGAGASVHGRFRVATENSVIVFMLLFEVFFNFLACIRRKKMSILAFLANIFSIVNQ